MKRFTMLFGLGLLVLSLAWVLAPGTAEGVIPERINLQGILRDGGGNPVADGSYSVIFTIYNADVGGTVFWAETTSVATADGLFNIRLGATNPIPDTAIRLNTWLGITLSPDPEMTPRTRLTAVSHAYKVSTVTGASGGNVIGDIYLLGSGADDYLGLVTSDPNVALDLRSGTFGGNPFIDFSNDAASDFDARIQLQGNDGLQITVPSILSIPTGNVGIGTTSPASRLHVSEDLDEPNGITIENSNTGTSSGEAILFNSEDGSGLASGAFIATLDASNPSFPSVMRIGNNRTSGYIDFITASTPRMVIENGGDVGIGTTTPQNRLDVEGGAVVGATYSGTNAAPANGLLVEGNVGIGTTNPLTKLHISAASGQGVGPNLISGLLVNANANASNNAGVNVVAGSSGFGTVQFGDNTNAFRGSIDHNNSSGDMIFRTTALARMTITSTGEIGIGTTSPSGIAAGRTTLHVAGSSTPAYVLEQTGAVPQKWILFTSASDGGLIFRDETGGSVNRLQIGANGSAGLEVVQSGTTVATFNRTTDDGTVIGIQQGFATEGTISVSGTTVSYNAFTGSHYGWTEETLGRGELVTLTGINRSSHDNPKSEIIYGIKLSTVPNDPACLGSYLGLQESNQSASNENPHLVMAVGNGDMWVVDEGGDIKPGDYLISSSTRGHAMKDDEGKYPIGHIVARAAEGVDWSTASETAGGRKHKKISVLFGNFVRSNPSTVTQTLEGLQEIILKQQKEIEELKNVVLKGGSSVMAETKQ